MQTTNLRPIADIDPFNLPRELQAAVDNWHTTARYLPERATRALTFMSNPLRPAEHAAALGWYANWLADLHGWNDRDWLRP